MSDPEALARVHIFPVRHHSPRCSAVLATFLAKVRPKAVLVEAPEDAQKLLGVLVDPATRPPVAILGYRTDGVQATSLWPLAAYSPEYVAAMWGVANGVDVAFIDIPVCRVLAAHAAKRSPRPPDSERPDDHEGVLDVREACAKARGFRSFDEFWEASFEAPAYEPEAFRAALLAYADLVRAADFQPLHRARDAHMARRVLERLEAGLSPDEVVVVVGAAHAAAFVAGDVYVDLARQLPNPVQTEVTLIPFSFPRLAEQLGYGAGNRAPQYYQRAHEAGCSFQRATLAVLVEFTEHLRMRGFTATLGDTIEAYRLAVSLAELRGKSEPGLDEVREATVATLCRGDATHVDGFLWRSVMGSQVGAVAAGMRQSPLQAEFWREVEARGLPRTDALSSFLLKLNEPIQVETSVFLHRLRVVGVPYAAYVGKQLGKRRGRTRGEPSSELDALTRVSEAWEAQWTPATDVALVERVVLGCTLEEVTSRVLADRLDTAKTTGEVASVLLEAVVTASAETVDLALAACDRCAAGDDDLPSLARAAFVLSGLVSFGTSRAMFSLGDEAIQTLCTKTFDRAVLRVFGACHVDNMAVVASKRALRALHEVALAQPLVDRGAWLAAARSLVYSYSVNPGAAGLAAGLLYLARVLNEDEIGHIVAQRLSNTLEPARAATFLGGFFEVNALALVKSRPVVVALDAFLTGLPPSRFRDALPVLRRAFAVLGPTERRYLLENVFGARRIGDNARALQTLLAEKDREKLRAMSAELSQAMDDLDELL